jgi:hypothetical protein
MFTKTLAQWKTRVTNLAGINGQVGAGSTFRHETAMVDEIADETYKRLQSLVTGRRFREFLVPGSAIALSSATVPSGESYMTVPYPTGAKQVKGVDILRSGEWERLDKQGWSQRRDHTPSGYHSRSSEAPYAWDVISHGSVAATTLTAGTIGLFPRTTIGSVRIWYLPEWTNIAGNDTYLYLYREQSWYDYHVFQGVIEICGIRDNDSSKRAAYAEKMSAKAELMIGENMSGQSDDGPQTWTRDQNFNG